MQETLPVRFIRTECFRRAYRELVKKALAQFLDNRTHPGLRVRRVRGKKDIWEMQAGQDIRITFEYREGTDSTSAVALRNAGHHDPTLKDPWSIPSTTKPGRSCGQATRSSVFG